ncbi:MAG: hypothetical protein HWN81_00350 [Candidatus Lokiarchaeota archaeon]|nr:hypothetical protein [Candidatus Lokiarchaeota archaeon]
MKKNKKYVIPEGQHNYAVTIDFDAKTLIIESTHRSEYNFTINENHEIDAVRSWNKKYKRKILELYQQYLSDQLDDILFNNVEKKHGEE